MLYLVLASKSPRRKELLSQAGFDFQVSVSNVDETVNEINPVEKVLAIAKKKGLDIYSKYNDEEAVVLSADTIVVINNQVLGKPKDKDDARLMMKMLQNNVHQVYTAVFIKSSQFEDHFVEKTDVFVGEMSNEEIEEYINTKEPYDKAGGYGIQGMFSKYISSINGDYYNVMGLPIFKVCQVLKKYDFTVKKYCIVCKNEVSKNDEICPHCGNKLQNNLKKQICPSCHKINSPNNKYCIVCGTKLIGERTVVINKNECIICHHINKEGIEYCESCGTLLNVKKHINQTKEKKLKDYGNFALVSGIIAVVISTNIIMAILALIPGILAIIFSSISLKRGYRGKNILGLIFGIVGLLTVILSIFLFEALGAF